MSSAYEKPRQHSVSLERGASVNFREKVRAGDREWVREVVESSGFFTDRETEVAVELVDEALQRGEKSGYYFLFAEETEGILGYTCFGPIACTRSSFDLYWIAVRPEVRGRGLGRELLKRTEALIEAKGGTRVYVETSSQPLYEPTRAFYEHNGYGKEALIRDFYAPGDHKILYGKVLKGSGLSPNSL